MMKRTRSVPVLFGLLLFCLKIVATVSDRAYDEAFRPQFHFSPSQDWMNDPNGLVYYQGEYHLFFQYNPFGNEWGHMSWGHAISTDLVHWKQLPVAIREDDGVMIFSGSAVVDWNNTSGLCKSSGDRGRSCLVAIYTGYNGKIQNQNIAYSNDRGRTWTKYSGNPVIDLNLPNFRDPKVFWYAPNRTWVMVAVLSDQHKVRMFASKDLKHWAVLSDFGPAGAVGGVWECPDLFELPIENEPGQHRWILSVNINPGAVAGGSGNQYFVGRFDGTNFIDDNPTSEVLWADYGKDFYASTSISDMPLSDGRRVWIGWLDNWEYARKLPTFPWRGQQSIPRALMLKSLPAGIRLMQEPVAELKSLRAQSVVVIRNEDVTDANRKLQSKRHGETLEIEITIAPTGAESFGFEVRKNSSEKTVVGIDFLKSELFVDRTHSEASIFAPTFPGRQTAPLNSSHQKVVALHIFIDKCSVEVFADNGQAVISDLIFPAPASDSMQLYSDVKQVKILKLEIWSLKSAWVQ